jgi:hypothetical protein
MRMQIIFIMIIVLTLSLIQLSACASSQISPTPNTYWKGSGDLIETNDVARLQKELPFTIILPEYLPDRVDSYRFWMLFHKIGQDLSLSIEYDSLKNAREIHIVEGPPQDGIPRPLSPGRLAKMNPDYTAIEIASTEVLEDNGYGTVLRNTQNIEVSTFYYIWEQNGLQFSSKIQGYDQAECRKIVESMIK